MALEQDVLNRNEVLEVEWGLIAHVIDSFQECWGKLDDLGSRLDECKDFCASETLDSCMDAVGDAMTQLLNVENELIASLLN